MTQALKPRYLDNFSCTGPACPDNCCNRFTVLVDPATLKKYETSAPELLDFVTEKDGIGKVLAFDKQTGCCPKMEAGSCTIHANYGSHFLTDVCHLYPRITRKLGHELVMSGTVSCPEIARLALFEEDAFETVPSETDRVPFNVKDYLPSELNAPQADALNKKIISLVEQSDSAEQFLSKMAFFIMRFGEQPLEKWGETFDAGWKMMDVMVPAGQADDRDPFFLLIALTTLLTAGKIKPSQRLSEVLGMIEVALNCTIDADMATVDMQPDSMQRAAELKQLWDENYSSNLQPILKKLVMAKLHSSLYPFAGLGENPQQKISWFIIHFATIRIGLMALCAARGEMPDQDGIIQVVQTITRVLDHLNNLDFALPMVEEAGWLETQRLIGLLT